MPKSLLKNTLHCSVLSSACLTAYANQDQGDPVKLDAIVVTASGYEQAIADAPASITVIDREELDKRNYNDITDVLADVPGVTISGSGSTLDVSIRGMSSQYTLFLVDGKKQDSRSVRPNGDDYGLEKGILPPLQAIERIEVIRGPMSSLYGSDAMGGVVNIITKKMPDKWSGSYDVSTTLQDDRDSGDIIDTNLYLAGPLTQKLAMQIAAGYFDRDEDNILGGFKGTRREHLNTKFTYVINENHDIAFDYDTSKQIGEETAKTAASNIRGKLRFYRDVFSLTHNGKYSDHLNSTSYIQYEDSDTPDRENTRLTSLNGGIRVNQPIILKVLTANSQWNWQLNDHKVSAGVYYKDEKLTDKATNINPTGVIATDFSRWSNAVFLEDTWSVLPELNFTAGLRWDNDENYGSHFSPRIYSVWHINDMFTLKGGVTTGYKQPDLRNASNDFYQVSGRGTNITRGNSELKPESSVTSELGFVWSGDLTSASITAYQTDFKDKITTTSACSSPNSSRNDQSTWACELNGTKFININDRINVDEAQINGLEVTFDRDLNEWSTLRANYTYIDSEQKTGSNKGRPLNTIPKHNVNVTFDTQPNDDVNLWARYNYRGEALNSSNEALAAYSFYDAGLNYHFNEHLVAKLGVYNLFDKRISSEAEGKLLDGRRYTIGLTTNF